MVTRRNLLISSAAALTGATLLSRTVQADTSNEKINSIIGEAYTPITTPNGTSLPWKLVDGVKVFHLTAETVKREFAPGLVVDCWGYNGMTPGPTIEAVEGDKCRFYITNKLPEPTTVHWHGLFLPNGMDGVSGLTQKYISPGETFKYEFTLKQSGTFMYHPHFDEMTQMAMGMQGMFIIHPKDQINKVDRDFAYMLSEWRINPGTSRPVTTEMTEFNILTLNSKVFPATDPLVVKQGERVRIRFGNLGAMDHHPMHLHGHAFKLVGTDGGRIPEAGQWPQTTMLVPVGTTREIEFIADAPGDWPLHCHMTHHTMNQMGHGLPNLMGVKSDSINKKISALLPDYMTMGTDGMGSMMDMGSPKNTISMLSAKGPFGRIEMGGMFTLLKVRDGITSYEDPGWYEHPKDTVAQKVSNEELKRDLG